MNRTPILIPLSVALLLVAACDDEHPHHHRAHDGPRAHHYKPGDGSINLEHDEVLIRAGGTREDAKVGIDGSLTIGTRVIETSPEGRAALREYDADAVAIERHGMALGVAGAQFGLDTAKDVLHGLFNGTADEAGKRAEQGAEELAHNALELCGRLDGMFKAQQSAAALVPEFKPYAVIAEHQVRDCFSEEQDRRERDDHDDPEDHDDGAAPDAAASGSGSAPESAPPPVSSRAPKARTP